MLKLKTTLLLLMAATLFSGCHLFSKSDVAGKTTLILLPDADGKVGEITVKTKGGGSKTINKAYNLVTTDKGDTAPVKGQTMTKAQMHKNYAALIKAEPTKPVSYLVYFGVDSTKLKPSSKALLPGIVKTIKMRTPTNISIIGHTDTPGTDAINDRLALKRALAVEKILKAKIPTLSNVTIQSFGAKELLIPTGPNVYKRKNRRVEILIP